MIRVYQIITVFWPRPKHHKMETLLISVIYIKKPFLLILSSHPDLEISLKYTKLV